MKNISIVVCSCCVCGHQHPTQKPLFNNDFGCPNCGSTMLHENIVIKPGQEKLFWRKGSEDA